MERGCGSEGQQQESRKQQIREIQEENRSELRRRDNRRFGENTFRSRPGLSRPKLQEQLHQGQKTLPRSNVDEFGRPRTLIHCRVPEFTPRSPSPTAC